MHEATDPGTADDAMTGDDERNRICPARLADGAWRRIEFCRDVAVGTYGPGGNLLHRAPNALGMGATVQCQRQIENEMRIV